MKIPRCRATVSEEIAAGHWGNPGRPVVIRRTSKNTSLLASQETGVNRPHQPLSRDKGGVHAVLRNFRFCCIPAGSGVGCRSQNQSCRSPIGGGCWGASGIVPRRVVDSSSLSRLLPPRAGGISRNGRCFLPRSHSGRGICRADHWTFPSSSSEAITVSLRLAPATETVNVSATRTLVPSQRGRSRRRNPERRATGSHAAGGGRRCPAFSSRRGGEHSRATRRTVVSVRARRRVHLQQSDCGRRSRQRSRRNF